MTAKSHRLMVSSLTRSSAMFCSKALSNKELLIRSKSQLMSGLLAYLRIFSHFGSFQIRLLAGNLNIDHYFELPHGCYSIEALTSEIATNVSHHGTMSLESNAVYTVADLEHVTVNLGYYAPFPMESATLPGGISSRWKSLHPHLVTALYKYLMLVSNKVSLSGTPVR